MQGPSSCGRTLRGQTAKSSILPFLLAMLSRTSCILLLGWLSACAGGTQESSATSTPKGPNIVVFVVDTLRVSSLGFAGKPRPTSPTPDALAGRGVIFECMYSQAPWTKPSVASLLPSLYPQQHKVLDEGTANLLSPYCSDACASAVGGGLSDGSRIRESTRPAQDGLRSGLRFLSPYEGLRG
ncbi:MAG: hypothetical protein ACI841_000113 [Planctomycetota bacterium]|jgi:hypothetical protein